MDRPSHPAARSSLVVLLSELSLLTSAVLLLCVATGCSPSERGETAAESGAGKLDREQMRVAISETIEMTDTLERVRRTVQLVDTIDESNLEGAITAYESVLHRIEPGEIRLFANAWAQIDPRGAVERILDWSSPRLKNEAIEEVVYYWARSGDGDEARAYVEAGREVGYGQSRSPMKFMVLAVLRALAAAQDWENLIALLEKIPDDGNRELWLTEVNLEIMRTSGLDGVKAFMDAVPWDAENGIKLSVLRRGLDAQSKINGAPAGDWYLEYESRSDPAELLPMTITGWSVLDSAGVIDWLGDREPSAVRDRLMRVVAVGWLGRKPQEARAWMMERIDDERLGQRLTFPLALNLGESDPEAALELAQRVETESEQIQAYTRILLHWLSVDAPAAEAYIASGRVRDDVAQQIMKQRNAMKVERRRITPTDGPGV